MLVYYQIQQEKNIAIIAVAEKKANGLPSLPLRRISVNYNIYYPTPYNLLYGWSFGSLAGIFLSFQIITGCFLALHYTPNMDCAFNSVILMMLEVNNNWMLRFIHAHGASLFFLMLYWHTGKALYFRSYTPGYTKALLSYGGIVMFLLMMGTTVIWYVLPFEQMSLWGTTVITNLLSAIPLIGEPIAYWIWGGFVVGHPVLILFFSFFYMLPFIVVNFILLHLIILHVRRSSNPLKTESTVNYIDFFHIVCFNFLTFPNVIGGVVAMLSSILILFSLPAIDTYAVKTPTLRRMFRILFCFFNMPLIVLGKLGGYSSNGYYLTLSQVFFMAYFFLFFISLVIK